MHRTLSVVLLLAAALPHGAAAQTMSDRVRRLVLALSPERKAAQLVMPWLDGEYAAYDARALDDAARWVDSLGVGGLVVSVGSPLDIAAKLNELQRRAPLPLLVASDLEGGSAFRFVGGTPFPTNMGVAATGRERDAYLMGRITALEGRAAGIHLTFSPVADVNNNPANPIINTRSFGGDPAQVAHLVAETVRGVQSTGMLATVKHFPGHGDTDVDSHLALPTIPAGWPRLRSIELVPFRAAIEAGVAAVMTAHVTLPRVDPDSTRPATLSPILLREVLRDSLGFDGLVITDALDMGALLSRHGPGELAVRAFLAGADLLLMPTDPIAAVQAVAAAARSGRIPRAQLDRSVARVLALKERLGLFERRTVPLSRIGTIVGRRAYADSVREVSERAIVLVRDSTGAVDRLRETGGDVALVVFADGNQPAVGARFRQELEASGRRVRRAFRLVPASGPASYDSARAALRAAPTAVIAVAVRAVSSRGSIAMPEALAELIDTESRTGNVILVSFGSPYLLAQVPAAGAFLLAWTSNPFTEAAAARALAGAPITGRAPIAHPPFFDLHHGLMRPAAEVAPGAARR